MFNKKKKLLLIFTLTFTLLCFSFSINQTLQKAQAQYINNFFNPDPTQGFWGTSPSQATWGMPVQNFFGSTNQNFYGTANQPFFPTQAYNYQTLSFFNSTGTNSTLSSTTDFFGNPLAQTNSPYQSLTPYNFYGGQTTPYGAVINPVASFFGSPYSGGVRTGAWNMPVGAYGQMLYTPMAPMMGPGYGYMGPGMFPQTRGAFWPYGNPMYPQAGTGFWQNNSSMYPYGNPYYSDYDSGTNNSSTPTEGPEIPDIKGYWVGDWERIDPNLHSALVEGQIKIQFTEENTTTGVLEGKIIETTDWEFEYDLDAYMYIVGSIHPSSNKWLSSKFLGLDGYIYYWYFNIKTVSENLINGSFTISAFGPTGNIFNETYTVQMSPFTPSN